MRARRQLLVFTVTVAAIALPSLVTASRGPCREDVARLCSGEKKPSETLGCLRAHVAELSPSCRARLVAPKGEANAKEKAANDSRPCAADAKRLCKGIAGGPAAIPGCLEQHQADLSPACRAKIQARRPVLANPPFSPCTSDIQRLCKGKPDPGATQTCLKEHESELSAPCKARLHAPAPLRCNAEIQRLCKGVEAGGGRVIRCLEDHRAELSQPCSASLQAHKQPRVGAPLP